MALARLTVVCCLALRAYADDARFDANVSKWWWSSVPANFETLESAAQEYLLPRDYHVFKKATGTSVQEILEGIRDCDANATRDNPTLPHEALPVFNRVLHET